MKKLLAMVLTAIMVFAVLPVMSSAEENIIPISECGGVISSGKIYSISTAEEFLQFEEINKDCRGATIVLTNDITIHDGVFTVDENLKPLYNGSFALPEPIEAIDSFRGTFDGQEHIIRGLYVKDEKKAGLVEELIGTIKNVNIENSLFIAKGAVGSICGVDSSYAKVEKCFSKAIVICEGENLVGGGIAGGFQGTMTDCYFNGTVIAEQCISVGGIVGEAIGTFNRCINAGEVYGGKSWAIGGFAGIIDNHVSYCSNTGKVYGESEAGNFVGYTNGFLDNCYAAGEVFAANPSNFMSDYYCAPKFEGYTSWEQSYGGSSWPSGYGFYTNFVNCVFVARYGDTADFKGNFDQDYQDYLDSIQPDPYGMGQIVDDIGLESVTEDYLKNNGKGLATYLKEFVLDTGNENNGYILPEILQRRTVAPSITNVEYEKSFDTRNIFTVTVEGRPAMIQFVEPTNGTRTYDRNHKNVTIKSYDADGNEVNSLDRTLAYEVWSIYSNMMPNAEIRTRAKYLSNAIYTWDSETYDFPMIQANPIVSMELSKVKGGKGAIPATVVTDDKTERVMFKMPNNTSVTVSTFTTDENGNRVFVGKAWMNEDGLNEINVHIYRKNAWKLAGTLEYTVE